ncbi:hypothetical protein L226DRAFT_216796 [Lentinus tigrinus ALCF2SS1-7]|uniref:uncharacterized protein n=1 Tax=Lentinus tigrinus ALCF2SS1-7 TaxID=1328758 RepID=UPI001166076A|nr:hypothetical protein L226DRAFT_216796 [Lentinus tigrinus ALCF2SS1-7]
MSQGPSAALTLPASCISGYEGDRTATGLIRIRNIAGYELMRCVHGIANALRTHCPYAVTLTEHQAAAGNVPRVVRADCFRGDIRVVRRAPPSPRIVLPTTRRPGRESYASSSRVCTTIVIAICRLSASAAGREDTVGHTHSSSLVRHMDREEERLLAFLNPSTRSAR